MTPVAPNWSRCNENCKLSGCYSLQTFQSVALLSPPERCKTVRSLVPEATWFTSSEVHSHCINNRPLRLSRRVLAYAGATLRGTRRNSRRRTPDSGKNVRRVQRDGPHQVCSYRTENERNIHYVKKREEQEGVRKKASANNELRMPAEIQKRIRRPPFCVGLPDFQKLLGTLGGKAMPLPTCREETCDCSKEQ